MPFAWQVAGVRLVKTPSAAGSAFSLAGCRSALGENTKRGGKRCHQAGGVFDAAGAFVEINRLGKTIVFTAALGVFTKRSPRDAKRKALCRRAWCFHQARRQIVDLPLRIAL